MEKWLIYLIICITILIIIFLLLILNVSFKFFNNLIKKVWKREVKNVVKPIANQVIASDGIKPMYDPDAIRRIDEKMVTRGERLDRQLDEQEVMDNARIDRLKQDNAEYTEGVEQVVAEYTENAKQANANYANGVIDASRKFRGKINEVVEYLDEQGRTVNKRFQSDVLSSGIIPENNIN